MQRRRLGWAALAALGCVWLAGAGPAAAAAPENCQVVAGTGVTHFTSDTTAEGTADFDGDGVADAQVRTEIVSAQPSSTTPVQLLRLRHTFTFHDGGIIVTDDRAVLTATALDGSRAFINTVSRVVRGGSGLMAYHTDANLETNTIRTRVEGLLCRDR